MSISHNPAPSNPSPGAFVELLCHVCRCWYTAYSPRYDEVVTPVCRECYVEDEEEEKKQCY